MSRIRASGSIKRAFHESRKKYLLLFFIGISFVVRPFLREASRIRKFRGIQKDALE